MAEPKQSWVTVSEAPVRTNGHALSRGPGTASAQKAPSSSGNFSGLGSSVGGVGAIDLPGRSTYCGPGDDPRTNSCPHEAYSSYWTDSEPGVTKMSVSEVLGAVRKGKQRKELGSARVCSSK